jgi:hypothetical protein
MVFGHQLKISSDVAKEASCLRRFEIIFSINMADAGTGKDHQTGYLRLGTRRLISSGPAQRVGLIAAGLS